MLTHLTMKTLEAKVVRLMIALLTVTGSVGCKPAKSGASAALSETASTAAPIPRYWGSGLLDAHFEFIADRSFEIDRGERQYLETRYFYVGNHQVYLRYEGRMKPELAISFAREMLGKTPHVDRWQRPKHAARDFTLPYREILKARIHLYFPGERLSFATCEIADKHAVCPDLFDSAVLQKMKWSKTPLNRAMPQPLYLNREFFEHLDFPDAVLRNTQRRVATTVNAPVADPLNAVVQTGEAPQDELASINETQPEVLALTDATRVDDAGQSSPSASSLNNPGNEP